MNAIIQPGRSLYGEVFPPGDKSLSHRAALFAAMAEGRSVIDHFLFSGVTQVLLESLSKVGVTWTKSEDRLTVDGLDWRCWRTPAESLFCGNSATTLRLLAGAVAAAGVPALLDGSEGLRRRPMDRIAKPLQRMGVPVTAADGCRAPLKFSIRPASQRLKSTEYLLPVASAQVKSCLLLAALAADGPVTLREPGPSRDHTERMLRGMGVHIEPLSGEAGAVRLYPSETPLRPLAMTLPGDISSAAFPLVAALIVAGSDVIVRGVCVNPTRTGLLDALAEMGASIERRNPRVEGGEPVADMVAKTSRLSGIRVSGERVVRMIDEFPAFAVAACFAHGRTEVRDAQELRGKESDRISMLCSELRGLGVEVEEFPDGFAIEGGTLRGGTVDAHGDHRLAMSMAIAGLASQEGVTVRQMEIVRESYPGFFEMLQGLGADVRVDSGEVPTP